VKRLALPQFVDGSHCRDRRMRRCYSVTGSY
jgi:hypothetical protein